MEQSGRNNLVGQSGARKWSSRVRIIWSARVEPNYGAVGSELSGRPEWSQIMEQSGLNNLVGQSVAKIWSSLVGIILVNILIVTG